VHRDDLIRDVVIDWARELSIPVRHFTAGVAWCGAFYGQTATGDPLPELITVPTLLRILSDLPDGFTELACHPALFVDFESVYGGERVSELTTLCDPQVVAAIESLGIDLCSFRDIRDYLVNQAGSDPGRIRERSVS
jgi:chitin disaccharide deacetylase